jgi:hypothetical protein
LVADRSRLAARITGLRAVVAAVIAAPLPTASAADTTALAIAVIRFVRHPNVGTLAAWSVCVADARTPYFLMDMLGEVSASANRG